MAELIVSKVRIYKRNDKEFAAKIYDQDGIGIMADIRGSNLSQLAERFVDSETHLGDGLRLETIEGPEWMNVSREYHDPVRGRDLAEFMHWYGERMKMKTQKEPAKFKFSSAP